MLKSTHGNSWGYGNEQIMGIFEIIEVKLMDIYIWILDLTSELVDSRVAFKGMVKPSYPCLKIHCSSPQKDREIKSH